MHGAQVYTKIHVFSLLYSFIIIFSPQILKYNNIYFQQRIRQTIEIIISNETLRIRKFIINVLLYINKLIINLHLFVEITMLSLISNKTVDVNKKWNKYLVHL